jgi:hypothetical protein
VTKIVIELDDKRNGNPLFTPLQKVLRGRWEDRHLEANSTSSGGLKELTEIPGLYLQLDYDGGEARVTDPLSLPENAALARSVFGVVRRAFKQVWEPFPEEVHELNESGVATWHHWLKVLVKTGKARVVSGAFPANDPPGDVLLDPYAAAFDDPKYASEMKKHYQQSRSQAAAAQAPSAKAA